MFPSEEKQCDLGRMLGNLGCFDVNRSRLFTLLLGTELPPVLWLSAEPLRTIDKGGEGGLSHSEGTLVKFFASSGFLSSGGAFRVKISLKASERWSRGSILLACLTNG
jgi:hypothetical protein